MAVAVAVALALVLAVAAAAQASNDPAFAQQWALGQVGAPAAWGSSTGAGVTIGIVDTGIDLGHEDLAGRVVAHTDCVGSEGDPSRCAGSAQDHHGHGTHVAGIAAATKDNGLGIAGAAPDARLVVAKALNADGSGKTSDATAGIKWVVDRGARVVNLSFGDDALVALSGTSLREGVEYAWSHGAVPVLAAGNTNVLGVLGGSDYRGLHALVVGATTRTGQVAGYSSPLRNAAWSLVAPGGSGGATADQGVLSTWRGNRYAVLSGTSMAAPHVAGGVALLLARGMSRDAAVERILDTADPSVRCGGACRGRLDLARAVGAPPAAATPAPEVTAASRPAPTVASRPAAPAPAPTATTAPAPDPAPTEGPPPEEAPAQVAAAPLRSGDDPSAVFLAGLVACALVVGVGGATVHEAWRRRFL